MQQRQVVDVHGKALGEGHDDGEDHGSRAHHGGSDQHRLGRRFESIAGAVVLFQHVLGPLEVHVDVVVLLQFALNVGYLLDERQFIDRLCVIGDRAVGIDGDGHRSHAEEAEGHQAEGEYRRRQHQGHVLRARRVPAC